MHAKGAEIISAEGGSAAFEPLEFLAEGRTAEVHLVRDARPEREQVPLQLRIATVTTRAATCMRWACCSTRR